ncbi:2-amino-4-hydroxy-6-hydroxymethyldihydropteridine diphosphokinase [Thiomicrospira sp. WB1]|uniref:2-amino-4-hydroxy-6- hydroxymethyldihydropteridine diphosphokinase n=1 Tax=Thiomicrospira sp. WB1 TaxID=1685380 RepID=UPI000749DDE0|nr:2-amino-4-hydroxy-6-hydroxymethyldihydropteridine diphosphokinase [Thiomicrospira sp. WB1]KUJ71911.1 2-amino-4-hydroxy-6-hydroxymethyldihydropteridine pyrophosphokinase [Thiomicrospira sp. WB1]
MNGIEAHTVYIGLGSNLDQPLVQVQHALHALSGLKDSELVAHSRLYASRPQGPQDQPDYVNAVACLRTQLTSQALLNALQSLEQAQGKVKQRHWGERVIDLDVLLFDDQVMDSDSLTLPHPCIAQRDFVLVPLLELAPELRCPRTGQAYHEALARLPEHFLDPCSPPRSVDPSSGAVS